MLPGSWWRTDQVEELGKYQAMITLEDASLTPYKIVTYLPGK